MPDEATTKEMALEHTRRVNAGKLEELLKLYAPAVRFEDPVGSGERIGHGALRSHVKNAIACQVNEVPLEPVGSPSGRYAAVEVTSTMNYLPNGPLVARTGVFDPPSDPETARMRISCVMVIRVGVDGLIDDMRSYWGPSDVVLLEGPDQ
ncbi:nuclear transport factor 2 family protein [Streptomyces sp. NBRC 109706]|uniref:nuclear transport factor 2 family protein n=1 Tax=Streptomyces sp. NBRC 109706 TaxID=1550035 RepID=UPI00131A7B88|nr:nuclear transport factor 2 family protein [Streptomyces sp. NBRC 109706]